MQIKPAPCFPVGPESAVSLVTTDQGKPSYAEVWWDEPLPAAQRDFRWVAWTRERWT